MLMEAPFPTVLTFWHLLISTAITQILARTTSLIDLSKSIPMNSHLFVTSILPIELRCSLNLVINNRAFIFMSVAFIEMFKIRLNACGFCFDHQNHKMIY